MLTDATEMLRQVMSVTFATADPDGVYEYRLEVLECGHRGFTRQPAWQAHRMQRICPTCRDGNAQG